MSVLPNYCDTGMDLIDHDELTTLRTQVEVLTKERDQAQIVQAKMWSVIGDCLDTFGHNHWDDTMEHGRGCPLCIKQREARSKAHGLNSPIAGQALLDQLHALQADVVEAVKALESIAEPCDSIHPEECLCCKSDAVNIAESTIATLRPLVTPKEVGK